MNRTIKRLLAALAMKRAVDAIREQRQPQRRGLPSGLRTTGLLLGLAGGLYYVLRSGRLNALAGRMRGRGRRQSYPSSGPPGVRVAEGDTAAGS